MHKTNHFLDRRTAAANVPSKMERIRVRLALPIALIAMGWSAPPGWSIEPGFYEGEQNRTGIMQTWKQADRTIQCKAVDQIDLGILSHPKGYSMYFTPNQVKRFLQAEKHKDLLVVLLQQSIMAADEKNGQKALTKLEPFLDTLGYKRVLVLGAHAFGTFVVLDKKYTVQTAQ